MTKFYKIFSVVIFCCLFSVSAKADSQPIKIGEMMSYTDAPRYANPFREGWQLAVKEVNAAGGIKGRSVEVISRDDMANPSVAVRLAEELITREGVVMLVGAGLDHVGLAVSAVANKRQIPFLKMWGGKCENIEDPKNKYWFTNMECIDYYGYILAREAAKKPHTRWATIAPNYEYGRNVTESFKKALKKLRSDVVFVSERYPTLGKIAAQEELRAIVKAKPEAVFNQLFGSDIVQYLRVMQQLGMEKDYFHIGNYLGMPLTMRELGDAYPDGWYTHGMPEDFSDYPLAADFAKRYEVEYGARPDMTALEGYRMMQFALAALEAADDLSPDAIINALGGLELDTPTGRHTMRALDKQLHAGYWGGYTKRENGVSSFVDDGWIDLTNISTEYARD